MRSLRPFVKWLDTGRKGNEGGREGGKERVQEEEEASEGCGEERADSRFGMLWKAASNSLLLSFSLFLSWLELPVGREAKKGEKAKEEEGLSGTVLLQLITTLSSGRPALDVPPCTVIYGRPAAPLDLISYTRFRPRERWISQLNGHRLNGRQKNTWSFR